MTRATPAYNARLEARHETEAYEDCRLIASDLVDMVGSQRQAAIIDGLPEEASWRTCKNKLQTITKLLESED